MKESPHSRALSEAEIAIDCDTPVNAGPMPPVVVQTTPPQGAVVRSLAQIDVQFSEAIVGVDAGDLLVGGVAATEMTAAP